MPVLPRLFSPLDEALGLGHEHFAPQLLAGLVQLGTWLPFHQVPAAARSVWRVAVSTETVRRLSEQAGAALLAADVAVLTQLERGADVPAEAGPALQQLSVDGAMVPLRGGQWGEVKTLAIGRVEQQPAADGPPQPHAVALSYFSRLADADSFSRTATVETHRRGTATAQTVCGPADGAVWVQGFLDLQRPDAVRILDFPHAAEYLTSAIQPCFGANTVASQAWETQVRHELRHGEPATVLEWLCRLPVAGASDPTAAATARDTSVQYLAKRWEQIQYATFRAAGYPLGSGAVESANKLVVEARLKGSGMHWEPANVNRMLTLRTAWCSGCWEPRWQQVQQERAAARARQRRGAAPPPAATPPAAALAAPAPPMPVVAVAAPAPAAVDPAAPRTAAVVPGPTRAARRPSPTHAWRRYGRSLTPRRHANL